MQFKSPVKLLCFCRHSIAFTQTLFLSKGTLYTPHTYNHHSTSIDPPTTHNILDPPTSYHFLLHVFDVSMMICKRLLISRFNYFRDGLQCKVMDVFTLVRYQPNQRRDWYDLTLDVYNLWLCCRGWLLKWCLSYCWRGSRQE